ncbi:MAG: hypothetical protein MUF06_12425 [Pirellulaceae bacterium]|nr:hypothetical protein [Pirellulaceae bacterium]
MKTLFPIVVGVATLLPVLLGAQEPKPAARVLEVWGDRLPVETGKLEAVWLYPEDYEGYTIKVRGYIYEPQNFEFFPDLNGYLLSFEPVILGRSGTYHAHVGKCDFLSREKLNFFCTTAEGRRIREIFKKNPGESAIPSEVVFEVRKRDGIYFADLISFTPRHTRE